MSSHGDEPGAVAYVCIFAPLSLDFHGLAAEVCRDNVSFVEASSRMYYYYSLYDMYVTPNDYHHRCSSRGLWVLSTLHLR